MPGFTDEENTTAQGGSGGSSFVDRCDANEAVVGILGENGDEIDPFQFQCGELAVEDTDEGLAVRVVGTPTTPERGGFGGPDSFSFTCPDNEVVSGIHGRANSRVDSIGVYCERIEIPTN